MGTTTDLSIAEEALSVDRIVNERFVHVRPHTPLAALARLLFERRLAGVPVVGRNELLAGWIAATDLLGAMLEPTSGPEAPSRELGEDAVWLRRGFHLERHVGALIVADVMEPEPPSVLEGSSIETALELMLLDGLHELPVVDPEGRVRGLITDVDALAALLVASVESPALRARATATSSRPRDGARHPDFRGA